MSRNNEDRLTPKTGASQDAGTEVPPQTTAKTDSTNDGASFAFVTPTEFVELPSKGDYYPEGHILHGVETVEIRHMTAKDEDILTSRTLLRKGVALDRMLKNILVDKRINLDDMLVGDKNALIVAARKSGYGEEYETKVTCPSCGEVSQHVFDLSTLEDIPEVPVWDGMPSVTRTGNNFDVELPRSEAVVQVRLMTGKDEAVAARQARMAKKAGSEQELTLTGQFKRFIVSVNGDSSPRNIAYFVDHMPAGDSRFLRTMYKAVTPNVDMVMMYDCNSCGYASDMEVPFTADFFWPQ